jgi:hypothetical protein
MASTLYKGPALGQLPPCLICAGPGEGPRARLFLTHGVSVWLCAAHRAPAFLRRRAGRDLVASLGALWSGAGCFGARRRRALEDHLRRVRQPGTRTGRRPGSYSWPALRREAERRFGEGEPPAGVIAELRAHHREGPARAPSVRTMRRWFNDGRWLGQLARTIAGTARRAAHGATETRETAPPREPARSIEPPGGGGGRPQPRHRAPPRLW